MLSTTSEIPNMKNKKLQWGILALLALIALLLAGLFLPPLAKAKARTSRIQTARNVVSVPMTIPSTNALPTAATNK